MQCHSIQTLQYLDDPIPIVGTLIFWVTSLAKDVSTHSISVLVGFPLESVTKSSVLIRTY